MAHSYDKIPITLDEFEKWQFNKSINPRTGKYISNNGKIYKYLELINIKDLYINECITDIDPISLNYLWKTENNQRILLHENLDNIIFYKDNTNNVRFLEKESITHLKGYDITIDPVTQERLPEHIFIDIEGKKIIDEDQKTLDEIAFEVFQLFVKVSIFIDYNLFLNLEKNKLIKINYEISDFFMNNFNHGQRNLISTNVFKKDTTELQNLNETEIKLYLLSQFKILLECDIDEFKYMINYIIVGGLGLFIPEIKESYPDYSFSF